ncbi:MAG: branched-chain amino acid ABC transporter permease [Oscillospiraceae bacterium]
MFVPVLVGGLVLGCTYGMLALGYSLIYQASGYMNFTQPDLLMFGAFMGLTFFDFLKFPFPAALLCAAIVMFAIGMLMERTFIRTLVKKKAKNIYIVLSTIALSIILQNLAMLIWDSRQHAFPAIFPNIPAIAIGTASIRPESLLSISVALVAMVALHLFMNKTKFGTAMRASAQNKMAANVMGINVWKTISVTYGIAAALAGLGGIIVAPALSVSINLGSMLGMKSFSAAVVGGYGNMYGAVVGGVLIGLIETFVAAYLGSIYKDFVVFFLLIFMMLVKPTGIFNAKVYDA